MKITKTYINNLAYKIVGAAIEVHKELGPGLLEDIYKDCLVLELRSAGVFVEVEKRIDIFYKGIRIERHYRQDIIVDNLVIAELKSQDGILPIHKAQLLTYMKLNHIPKGLLINFNVMNLVKEGLVPMVNEIFKNYPE